MVESYGGLEEARRLVKWLRQNEMMMQMIAILHAAGPEALNAPEALTGAGYSHFADRARVV